MQKAVHLARRRRLSAAGPYPEWVRRLLALPVCCWLETAPPAKGSAPGTSSSVPRGSQGPGTAMKRGFTYQVSACGGRGAGSDGPARVDSPGGERLSQQAHVQKWSKPSPDPREMCPRCSAHVTRTIHHSTCRMRRRVVRRSNKRHVAARNTTQTAGARRLRRQPRHPASCS